MGGWVGELMGAEIVYVDLSGGWTESTHHCVCMGRKVGGWVVSR